MPRMASRCLSCPPSPAPRLPRPPAIRSVSRSHPSPCLFGLSPSLLPNRLRLPQHSSSRPIVVCYLCLLTSRLRPIFVFRPIAALRLFRRPLLVLCHFYLRLSRSVTLLALCPGRPPALLSSLLLRLSSLRLSCPRGQRVFSSLSLPALSRLFQPRTISQNLRVRLSPHALGSADASPSLDPRSPRVGSAGAPLPHHAFGSAGGTLPVNPSSSLVGRDTPPPSPPPWPAPSSPPSCASSILPDLAVPVLNLDRNGQPLTFRSALTGPHRAQWIVGDDDELIKLVETTRTLIPVHTYSSTPTYCNRVVKEKWTPSSLLLPGPSRSL
jgi:hypothetical protein